MCCSTLGKGSIAVAAAIGDAYGNNRGGRTIGRLVAANSARRARNESFGYCRRQRLSAAGGSCERPLGCCCCAAVSNLPTPQLSNAPLLPSRSSPAPSPLRQNAAAAPAGAERKPLNERMSAQRSLWDINLDEVNQFLDAVTMTAQRIPPQPQQPPLPSAPPRQSAEKVQQHMRPSLRCSAAVSLLSLGRTALHRTASELTHSACPYGPCGSFRCRAWAHAQSRRVRRSACRACMVASRSACAPSQSQRDRIGGTLHRSIGRSATCKDGLAGKQRSHCGGGEPG